MGHEINIFKFKKITITASIILIDQNAILLKIDTNITQIPKLVKATTTMTKTAGQYP